ncbi:MAG TPA: tetratricopeptide repeat protein, partial [bacterium]
MRGWLNGVCLVILVALMSYSIPSSVQAQGATTDQYYAAAGKLYAAKNYSQAAQYYYAAVKLNPSHAMAYQGLGNCYYALGRKADALTFYKRASALQPNNAQLAQFVQNLQAQVGGGQAAAPGAGMVAASPMAQGAALFQQKQFAASIPYFQLATQQTPNDYRPFYYAGYAYYMTQDGKDAALYFGVANAKQPSASIKAYADRIKASLSSDDQQWVDDQVAKYTQGGTAVAAGGGKKDDVAFGFHIPVGMEYILADPTQIKQYITNANSVSLTGITPNIIPFPELEPFVRLGNFEINLALGYFPVGNLSYTTYDLAQPNQNGGAAPDVWKYTYNTTIITADLGFKILFGDSKVKGYFGLGGGISP